VVPFIVTEQAIVTEDFIPVTIVMEDCESVTITTEVVVEDVRRSERVHALETNDTLPVPPVWDQATLPVGE
jgi:hypothetical protein